MKRIINGFLAFLLSLTVVSSMGIKPVYAAGSGTQSDPIKMTAGTTEKYTWDYNQKDLYLSFKAPARGYITFTINKPLDNTDDYSSYYISLIKSGGTEYRLSTYANVDSSSTNYSYKIGVKAGTYTLHVKNNAYYSSFSSGSYRQSHTVKFNYKFTKTNNYEIEPNHTKALATALTLGQTVSGTFGEEYGSYSEADYFKVSMAKGTVYQLKMVGYGALANIYGYFEIINPSGNSTKLTATGTKVSGSTRIWTYNAEATGTYYLDFYNAYNKKPVAYKISVNKYPANTWWGSKYVDENSKITKGWKTIGGKKYYFDSSGNKVTGLKKISGKYYYFSSAGVLQTTAGWKKISGKYYYFNSSGEARTGWQQISGKWYYFNSSAVMVTGWQTIGGAKYYFKSSGAMVTGWQKLYNDDYDEYDWYYFNSSGSMAKGWKQISGKWYYFNDYMYYDGYYDISGKRYWFKPNGELITGWYKFVDDRWVAGYGWVYSNSSGVGYSGWLKSGGSWYYIEKGDVYQGFYYIDGTFYAFDLDGKMYTNRFLYPYSFDMDDFNASYPYHVDADGKGSNGWVQYSSTVSYYYSNGESHLKRTQY